jgi:outer membrane biosynthesis protein TonB
MRQVPASPALRAALAALLVPALVAGCGGSDDSGRLTESRAASLRATLSEVERNFHAGECSAAVEQAAVLQSRASSLPSRVDRKIRRALVAGAERLQALVQERCQEPSTPAVPPVSDQTSTDEQDNEGSKQKKDKKPKKQEAPQTDEQPPTDELPPGQEVPPGQDGTTPPGQDNGSGSGTTGSGGAGL